MADHNSYFGSNGHLYGNGSYKGEYLGVPSLKNPEDSKPDEIDFKQLFYTLWHYKWILVGSVVIFGILAVITAYSITPVYQSEGSILISESQSSISAGGGGSDSDLASMLASTYGIGMGSTVANELQVLRSRKLSMQIADSLMEQQVMSNGRQYPVLFRSYPDDSTMTTQDTVAARISDQITFSQPDRDADLIQISYASTSPLEAANIVNISMQLYSDLSTHQNRMSASSAVGFLKNERRRIETSLNNAEHRLRDFMNQHKVIEVDAQTEELIRHMADLETKRQEAKVKLVAANSAIDQYSRQLNNIKPGLAEQYADAIGPNMTRMQYQLAELQIEKMQLIANNPELKQASSPPRELRDINQKIKLYKDKIRELTQNLMNQSDQYLGFLGGQQDGGGIAKSVTELNQKLIELKVEKEQYTAQLKVLDKQLAEQQQFFDNLPDNMIDLARLKRDVTINEELYLAVSKQYAEMSLWEQTQFGLGRPVDNGYVPKEPVKPAKKLYVLIGLIFGGIVGLGYVFVREAFNTTIDSVEKLRKFDLPLLAVIPDILPFIREKFEGKKRVPVKNHEISTSLVTFLDTISPISESFRRLESNIIYSNPDQKMTSLMVTSSTKGEGKTTVISNLGIILSEAGYNVAIIDTDLRRPNVHNVFGLRRSPGIVEVLFDGISAEEAMQETLIPNLSVLSSGRRPPNPSAVTQSKTFLDMVGQLESQYDFVLIDTAPFGIITDASALIKQTDGVLMVARFGKTSEAEIHHSLENLNRVKANIMGTVLSAFDYRESSDYYYGSSYYRNIYQDYSSYHH